MKNSKEKFVINFKIYANQSVIICEICGKKRPITIKLLVSFAISNRYYFFHSGNFPGVAGKFNDLVASYSLTKSTSMICFVCS